MQAQPDLKKTARQATAHLSKEDVLDILVNPVIILSAPRSGSTLLFEQLARFSHFWSIGGESHFIFNAFASLRAENQKLDSMALSTAHAQAQLSDDFRRCFLYLLRNNRGVPYLSLPPAQRPSSVCLLEKTPRNALNIPFLLKVFPGARFIYERRDARQTVSSLIEAWTLGLQTGRFITFRDLPDWPLPAWCFLLPPGWRELRGKSLAHIAAFQWSASNLAIMEGLSALGANRWVSASYSEFVENPAHVLTAINTALGFTSDAVSPPIASLPLSRTTVTPPHPDKWKRHEHEINALWPELSKVQEKINAFTRR